MDDIGGFVVIAVIVGGVVGYRLLAGRSDKAKFTMIGGSASRVIGGTRSASEGGIAVQDDQEPQEQAAQAPAPSSAPGRKTPDERKAILAQAIANALARPGTWRVESQSDYNAVIVKGKPVNHVLHLLLSIFTFGLWLIVWIVMGAGGGETRFMMTVDEYGNVNTNKL